MKPHAVILWRADNRYHIKDVVKFYQYQTAAQKAADRMNATLSGDNPGGYVVRTTRWLRGEL